MTDSTGTVASVSFYYETNGVPGLQTGRGGDTLLGTITNGSNGWSISLSASASATYVLYAVATGSNGLVSTPVSLTLTVQNSTSGPRFNFASASDPTTRAAAALPSRSTTTYSALLSGAQSVINAPASSGGTGTGPGFNSYSFNLPIPVNENGTVPSFGGALGNSFGGFAWGSFGGFDF